eukprot:TRINITY_DN7349_c0_g1_i7.p1 TRINITY_DN7349_c0_g1~~TRINITY_DN7349_c0_g1_i7.p1  ORF type:complete len:194 (-),score=53.66 TRINITY_DN7349_c0_g1_i7:304-885(-)
MARSRTQNPAKGRWISKKDYKIFKMLFAQYDTDLSGTVSYQEFQKAFSSSDDVTSTMLPSMACIFDQLDGDNNGEMSFRELLSGFYPGYSLTELDGFINKYDPHHNHRENAAARAAKPLTLEQEEELESLMKLFDQNSDGLLDQKEMALYCANLGIGDDTIAEWFEEFDQDKDGVLDMSEFKEFFKKQWTVHM